MPIEARPAIEVTEPPVGSILPYYFPNVSGPDQIYANLPRNWVLCDGQKLNINHHRKLKPEDVYPGWYDRFTPPDLTTLFIRGAPLDHQLGTNPQGSDQFPALGQPAVSVPSSDGGQHHHDVAAQQTGFIANQDFGTNFTPYRTVDDNQKNSADAHLSVDVDHGNHEGQHRHDLAAFSTGDTPAHHHDVTLPTIPTVPRYQALWFIMRIK